MLHGEYIGFKHNFYENLKINFINKLSSAMPINLINS